MGLRRHGEHVVGRVHVGLCLPRDDGHDVEAVPTVALLDAARKDVDVALGGPVEGELVPGSEQVVAISALVLGSLSYFWSFWTEINSSKIQLSSKSMIFVSASYGFFDD